MATVCPYTHIYMIPYTLRIMIVFDRNINSIEGLENIQGHKAPWELVEHSLTADPQDTYRKDDGMDIFG